MIRKILGGLLILEAALIIIGSIVNGSFMSDQGSAAATYGTFVGTIYSGAMGIISGGTYNMSPYEGYVKTGFEPNFLYR